jgi:UDP-N-acetylglucosamine/UDP-N-acetylgalactosamine diphosphorylase
VSDLATTSSDEEAAWRNSGLDLIAQGKVAALLMAGGQGTRLGSSEPKGCYDIHLLSHKSLFQLQAERLARLRQIAADHAKLNLDQVHVKWYIMVSPHTHASPSCFSHPTHIELTSSQRVEFGYHPDGPRSRSSSDRQHE